MWAVFGHCTFNNDREKAVCVVKQEMRGAVRSKLVPPCKNAKQQNVGDRVKRRLKKKAQYGSHNVKLKMQKKKAIRATVFHQSARRELGTLRRHLSEVSVSEIDKAMEDLPQVQQLAFRAALKAGKGKSPRGRHYEQEWLMTCLLLRISSPTAYRLMTKMKLMPLPTTPRLRQMTKGMIWWCFGDGTRWQGSPGKPGPSAKPP